MTQSTGRTNNTRGFLYFAVASLAAFALLAAFLFVAPNVSADPSTVTVNVELQGFQDTGSTILSIPANGSASYYANGWHAITATDPNNRAIMTVQLEPGTYAFAVTYNGTSDQKTVTIGNAATTVYFHAALVRVALTAHNHSFLSIPANGSASYYANGWHAITTPDPNNGDLVQTEMLPGAYSFAATYNGTSEQESATIVEPNPNNHANAVQAVNFETELVNIELQSSTDSVLSIPANGSASYYANGWHAITTLNVNNPAMVTAEMLPGTYTFSATYLGTSTQKSATVNHPNPNLPASNNVQTVYFHTGMVHSTSGNATAYYANGWHTFTQDMQLLPGTYTFSFNDSTPNTPSTLSGGHNVTNTIH